MKSWLFAGAAILVAATALAPMARADGPRASSENNWPGMTNSDTQFGYSGAPPQIAAVPQDAAPHYVWQEGYTHHGRWIGQWVLVH